MASQLTAATSSVPEISRDELLRRLDDTSLTIVDVLPQASYVEAHIPRAINIPLEQIQRARASCSPISTPRSRFTAANSPELAPSRRSPLS